MRVSRFERGTGCYTCRACGRRTRETGDSEGQAVLCRSCYRAAGIENEHYDGYHADEPDADCPLCRVTGEERKP